MKEVKYEVRYGQTSPRRASWWAEMLVPVPEMGNKRLERITAILKGDKLARKQCTAEVLSVKLEEPK